MVSKIIEATEIRVGTYLLIDGDSFQVKKADISKTGKHGHAKVRFEAISVKTGKKKVQIVPGHDKFEVPMIDKRQAQVLSIRDRNISLMDSENFENFDLLISGELEDKIKEGSNVEYWDVEGEKIIKKII
tara:strand:- start:5543 stop:5932 length:390 start_codon:yes stop_codon:yes gene_type:complete